MCATCTRLRIECQGYDIRLTWMQSVSRTKRPKAAKPKEVEAIAAPAEPSPAGNSSPGAAESAESLRPKLSSSLVMPPSSLSKLSSKDQFLLQHYFYTVSGILSSTHDRSINTYCRVILPMAMSSDMLMDTLLLVSTSHLSSRFEQFSLELPRYRSRVLPRLISRIDSWDGFDPTMLATIIMLSINEVTKVQRLATNWVPPC